MVPRTWLITGVSSGFGREMAQQLLERGERVVGTVRDRAKVSDLLSRWPVTFDAPQVDVTDSAALRHTVDSAWSAMGELMWSSVMRDTACLVLRKS